MSALEPHEIEALNAGKRVFRFSSIHWFALAPGEPVRAHWGETLSKGQAARVVADKLAVDQLAVGESVRVVRGYHPRHGDKLTTVTRVA